MFMCCHSFLW